MPVAKIAITIDPELLEQLDRLVAADEFESRSRAVQNAVRDMIEARDDARFEEALARLNPDEEAAMAEDGTGDLDTWPEY